MDHPEKPPPYNDPGLSPQPHPMAPQPLTQQPTNNAIFVNTPQPQVTMNGPIPVGPDPQTVICPHCRYQVTTSIRTKATSTAYLCCCILCLCGCTLGCCLIPFCISSMRDVNHYCPNCNYFVGRCRAG